MEPSPYSEGFTIACNHSREPAGEGFWFRVPAEGGSGCQLGVVPGVVHLGVRPVISWGSRYIVPC